MKCITEEQVSQLIGLLYYTKVEPTKRNEAIGMLLELPELSNSQPVASIYITPGGDR